MNRDDIIRMAREAGIVWDDHTVVGSRENLLERFAALVAAAKQEENDRLRRENAILRQELKFAIVDDIMNMNDVTEEEADAQAEQQINWLVLHNEGAE